MPSTGLGKSYSLDTETIDSVVTRKSAGTYVLGYIKTEKKNEKEVKTFIVQYVGRSDDDINGRLKKWVDSKYKRFQFGYYGSPKAAFEKECNIYHDFGEKELLDKKRIIKQSERKSVARRVLGKLFGLVLLVECMHG